MEKRKEDGNGCGGLGTVDEGEEGDDMLWGKTNGRNGRCCPSAVWDIRIFFIEDALRPGAINILRE